jgi:hypothetical protein
LLSRTSQEQDEYLDLIIIKELIFIYSIII